MAVAGCGAMYFMQNMNGKDDIWIGGRKEEVSSTEKNDWYSYYFGIN